MGLLLAPTRFLFVGFVCKLEDLHTYPSFYERFGVFSYDFSPKGF